MRLGPRGIAAVLMIVGSGGSALAQGTTRVSLASSGTQGNAGSEDPSISADVRYVAFWSDASELVAGDTNGSSDVFVHDRQSGATSWASVDSSGVQGNAASLDPSISADGRCVGFESAASNLVPGDTNGWQDVFVHDLQSGATHLVSVDSSGSAGNSDSRTASLSSDGRFVAFESDATNLVTGDTNGRSDIFVHDRQTGQTSRVSVDSSGAQATGPNRVPSLSADGRYVAFESYASNLVAGDTNLTWDIFVHDRQTGSTTRVNVDSAGAQASGESYSPVISADGVCVAFITDAFNLVPGDTNGTWDVYVHDRQSGSTRRASVDSSGAQTAGACVVPSLSADGEQVAFQSFADLVPWDWNQAEDIFVHDFTSGRTSRVSLDSSGALGNHGSFHASISAAGDVVAFTSDASNLVSDDTNVCADVFVNSCACIGSQFCTSTVNYSGGAATITAACSASSAAGELRLDAVPVPNQPGIFFHGTNQSQISFGNGYLCTTGDLARGAVIQASGFFASYTYDNSSSRHSLANFVGTTRHFQYWFRDPMAGGAKFNTSNAVSITIAP